MHKHTHAYLQLLYSTQSKAKWGKLDDGGRKENPVIHFTQTLVTHYLAFLPTSFHAMFAFRIFPLPLQPLIFLQLEEAQTRRQDKLMLRQREVLQQIDEELPLVRSNHIHSHTLRLNAACFIVPPVRLSRRCSPSWSGN